MVKDKYDVYIIPKEKVPKKLKNYLKHIKGILYELPKEEEKEVLFYLDIIDKEIEEKHLRKEIKVIFENKKKECIAYVYIPTDEIINRLLTMSDNIEIIKSGYFQIERNRKLEMFIDKLIWSFKMIKKLLRKNKEENYWDGNFQYL